MSQSLMKRTASRVWAYRRPIIVSVIVVGMITRGTLISMQQQANDFVHPDTYLTWRVFDGSIVEVRQAQSIGQLLAQPTPGDQPVRILELHQVVETLRRAKDDARIRGIVADFSQMHVPRAVLRQPLGLAQTEELLTALHEFRTAKQDQFGKDQPATVAWSDTFDSQTAFLLATGFDRVYMQSSGQVPLVGLGSSLTFFRRMLQWLGVRVLSETRNEYKSVTSAFVHDELPPEQLANLSDVLGGLQHNMARLLGQNRFSEQGPPHVATAKAEHVLRHGPYSASEALAAGLIDGICHRHDITPSLDVSETRRAFSHYVRICANEHADDPADKVAVIFLQGIMDRNSKSCSVSEAIHGLKQAAENKDIRAIVLRINSGGGEVIASEALWAAIQHVRKSTQKPVVASFGSVAASGAYYAASAADAIFACESTMTGSIGVAFARPTILRDLIDKVQLNVQTILAGSIGASVLHDLDDQHVSRLRTHVDEMYKDFLHKVMQGRGMSQDVLAGLAGGRIMTGLAAYMRCRPAQPSDELMPSSLRREPTAADAQEWTTRAEDNESGNLLVRIERADDDTAANLQNDLASLTPTAAHGRGLIDGIGGLRDAARYAYALHRMRARQADESPETEDAPAGATSTDKTDDSAWTMVRVPERVPLWRQLLENKSLWGDGPLSLSITDMWEYWRTFAYNTMADLQHASVHMRAETPWIMNAAS